MRLLAVAALVLAGCTQNQQNVLLGDDICLLPDEELEQAGLSRSAAMDISGEGAGRGRQVVNITCPDGTVITVAQDVEGSGGVQR